MIPPVFDESELPERLRRLLALEVDRIVDDLVVRREFLVELWSRHRDRGPFLDTVFSRWRTMSLTDLALLDGDAMNACDAFYRELDELRLYFQYTQDMPTTLAEVYEGALERIVAYGALAVQLLGGVPDRPIVSFEADVPPAHALIALVTDNTDTEAAPPDPADPGEAD